MRDDIEYCQCVCIEMNRKGIKIFSLDIKLDPEKELIKELVKKVEGKIKVPKPKNDN